MANSLRLSEAEFQELQRKRRQQSKPLACGACGRPAEACKCLPAKRTPAVESKLEIRFAQQLADRGIHALQSGEIPFKGVLMHREGEKIIYSHGYVRNYLDAIPGRNFELDFCWPDRRLFVEIDGMAHRTKDRFNADYEKHALLVLAGWRGLRVGGKDVKHGRAIEWTLQLLKQPWVRLA